MRASLLITLLAAGLIAAGCGSSSSSANAESYVGTWTFQSGTIVPNCSGITLGNVDLTGDAVTITKIDTSHIQMMVSGGGVMCDVHFTVDGSSAKADAGQTCALAESGYTATLQVSTWTLALSGSEIQMSMSGTASVSIVSCAPTSTGTMVRSGSDAAQSG